MSAKCLMIWKLSYKGIYFWLMSHVMWDVSYNRKIFAPAPDEYIVILILEAYKKAEQVFW